MLAEESLAQGVWCDVCEKGFQNQSKTTLHGAAGECEIFGHDSSKDGTSW